MSFLRHQEIFPSDGGANLTANTPAHRLDEFPAGYSLAGCSPAWPASASPTGTEYAVQSVCWSRNFHRTGKCVLTVCVSRGDKRTTNSKHSCHPQWKGQRVSQQESTGDRSSKHAENGHHPSLPSWITAPRKRRVCCQASNRQCQDRGGQIGLSDLSNSGVPEPDRQACKDDDCIQAGRVGGNRDDRR